MFAGHQRASLEALDAAFAMQAGFLPVGDVADVERLGAAVRGHRVDVVVLEGAVLGDGRGYAPIHDVLASDPQTKVLVIGGEPDVVAWALVEGASGAISAGAKLAEVVDAVRQLAASGAALSPPVQCRLLERYRQVGPGFSDAGPGAAAPFTAREHEIIRLVAHGGTNARIAAECGISASTVKNHLASIFRKLDVSSRGQAVAEAFRLGILDRCS